MIKIMELFTNRRKRLMMILALVAVHSFCVGIGLIIRPAELMRMFGFGLCYERFFPTQGGVFHIVMAIGYIMAAVDVDKYRCLAIFSIVVKLLATVFLLTYFLFMEPIWLVLASGIGDGLMGLLIYLSLRSYLNSIRNDLK